MAKDENAHDLDELVQHSLGADGIKPIIDWVARFSYWIDPRVVQKVPVVFPRTRRAKPKEARRTIVDGVCVWENQPAGRAFWVAYGVHPSSHTPSDYSHFILCHIYERSAHDPAHFTHLANLTVFPRCLESFSEWDPVRDVLKWHSYRLYGYTGPSGQAPSEPRYYPAYWPGVKELRNQELIDVVGTLTAYRDKIPMYYARRADIENRLPPPEGQ
jgi:hypothetical protein